MEKGAGATSSEAKVAKSAGLHYVNDRQPGIRRIRAGNGFRYAKAGGAIIKETQTLGRIKRLAIPPAWTSVWICADAHGHIQATGRDARGRKQYRYHPYWREQRDENKYDRMLRFGRALPRIRRCVRQHIRQPGLGREKVLAALTRLLEVSGLRVGNEEYAIHNRSYGLTTLRDRHARVRGDKIDFRFRGKSGKEQSATIEHPRLSRIVKKCQDLPGQDLFQYVDETGATHRVTSGDLNDYLARISGQDFTAKDFRTWRGTVLAALALGSLKPDFSRAGAKRNLVRAIEQVAASLGNTPAVCKKCYIHPVILTCYLDGSLIAAMPKDGAGTKPGRRSTGLLPAEATVLRLLQRGSKKA